jgi:hypothetical protein
MYQLSNNFHAYLELELNKTLFSKSYFPVIEGNPYDRLEPMSIGVTVDNWQERLREYEAIVRWEEPNRRSSSQFTALVLWPMWKTWQARKKHGDKGAVYLNEGVIKNDWLTAGQEWLKRRQDKLTASPQ